MSYLSKITKIDFMYFVGSHIVKGKSDRGDNLQKFSDGSLHVQLEID